MENHDEYLEKKLKEKIYEEELSIEELLKIKKQMINMNFDQDTFQYVNEMINDHFDVMELDKIIEIKNYIIEIGLDTTIVDKYIKRKSPLTNELIRSMDPDDISYIINEGALSLEQILLIKRISKTMRIDEDSLEYLEELLNDSISELDTIEEVKSACAMFNKYDITNSHLKRKERKFRIDDSFEVREYQRKNNKSLFGEIIASDINKYLSKEIKYNDDLTSIENYESY